MSTPPARPWMDRLAHDLRGPLSPMQTAVHLLRDARVGGAEREELFAVLERQVQRLAGMIDEFDDLTRAGQGRLLASEESMDLELLVADAAARLGARAPQVGFAPGTGRLRIRGDAHRLAQLFHSLLGLQLSRNDSDAVQAHIAAEGGRLRMVCAVRCRDASDALVASLLTSPHPDPPDEALGLRLVIASAIAEAHGGSVTGHATAHDTAEVTLELPIGDR
ncbi:histidine kinase dimerization/phospho-acceptor domain-containing protein [Luteimonas sp. MJ174]|uniref:sensor histidine kinase n=1 Tax=Luteimonas sp. MJ174 TaxID=3129237 RepID=UPI0031BB73FA